MESGEEDSQDADSDEDANETLMRSLNVPKSSQSVSLTPPKDNPKDVDMPDTPPTQGATRTRTARRTPAAFRMSEEEDTPPPSQANKTRSRASAARKSSRQTSSLLDEDERPLPRLPGQDIPRQPQAPEISESAYEAEDDPPVPTQTRVTTQLNSETAAAREPTKSSQFDASGTPTPAGREVRPGAARGAAKSIPPAVRSRTAGQGLSAKLKRQQAQKAGNQKVPSAQHAALSKDDTEDKEAEDEQPDDDDNSSDDEPDDADEDDTDQEPSDQQKARRKQKVKASWDSMWTS